jgi:hypothetical protein
MKLTLHFFVGIGCLMQPLQGFSAPFCVKTSYGTDCFYYSADSCRAAAQAKRGMCLANPDSADRRSRASEAPFCVQTSYGTDCFYYSSDSCMSAASAKGGMCIPNPDN